MIQYKKASLFDPTHLTNAVIIQGCNAQGVMGSGVAAQWKKLFNESYELYLQAHRDKPLELGQVLPLHYKGSNLYVMNCITQQFYGKDNKRYVDYDAVQECFFYIKYLYESQILMPLPLYMPKIGAGLGGGNWDIISSLIEETGITGTTSVVCCVPV